MRLHWKWREHKKETTNFNSFSKALLMCVLTAHMFALRNNQSIYPDTPFFQHYIHAYGFGWSSSEECLKGQIHFFQDLAFVITGGYSQTERQQFISPVMVNSLLLRVAPFSKRFQILWMQICLQEQFPNEWQNLSGVSSTFNYFQTI